MNIVTYRTNTFNFNKNCYVICTIAISAVHVQGLLDYIFREWSKTNLRMFKFYLLA